MLLQAANRANATGIIKTMHKAHADLNQGSTDAFQLALDHAGPPDCAYVWTRAGVNALRGMDHFDELGRPLEGSLLTVEALQMLDIDTTDTHMHTDVSVDRVPEAVKLGIVFCASAGNTVPPRQVWSEIRAIGSSRGQVATSGNSNDLNITFLVTHGCSGSSFAIGALENLIKLHGVQVWMESELFQNSGITQSPFCIEHDGTEHFWPEDDVEKVRLARAAFQNELNCKQVLNCKGTVLDLSLPTIFLVKVMKSTNAFSVMNPPFDNMVGMNRMNRLDNFICRVKDCFLTSDSFYPVWENGTRSDECFERRSSGLTDLQYRVHLDPQNIVRSLSSTHEDYDVPDAFANYAATTYEELCAFESGWEKALHVSVVAFGKLLRGLGMEPSDQIIERWANTYLHNYGLRIPAPHNVEIVNWEDIKGALVDTEFSKQWRD